MKIEAVHNGRKFLIPKKYFVLSEKVKRRPDFAELEKQHQERTKTHIERVIKFSQHFRILSQTFAGHDADKLDPNNIIYVPYILTTQFYKR